VMTHVGRGGAGRGKGDAGSVHATAAHSATMPARRSGAASVTSRSTPTDGPLVMQVHPAEIQDRDRAIPLKGSAKILSLRRARLRRQRLCAYVLKALNQYDQRPVS